MLAARMAVVALALGLGATGGLAQDKAISIELNDAVNIENACRLVFVAINQSGLVLDKTSYDVVTFDATREIEPSASTAG